MDHLRSQPLAGSHIRFDNQIEFRHGAQVTSYHSSSPERSLPESPDRSGSEPPDTVGRFIQQGDYLLIEEEKGGTVFRGRSSVGSSDPLFRKNAELANYPNWGERVKL